MTPQPTRVSVIRYLNAVPLAHHFHYEPVPDWLQWRFQHPAAGAVDIQAGRMDAALLPSVELQRIRDLVVLAGMSIASPGPVRSVILVTRGSRDSTPRVGVTPHSRTSVALLKVLAAESEGRLVDCPVCPDPQQALTRYGAALIIGDPAMTTPFPGCQVHDLAAWWRVHTGLPFVFAVWAIRRAACSAKLTAFLRASRDAGVTNRERIAADFGPRLGLTPADALAYLTGNLSFDLGPTERNALDTFHTLCHKHGLTPPPRPLEYIDD